MKSCSRLSPNQSENSAKLTGAESFGSCDPEVRGDVNPYKSSTRSLKTQATDGVVFEAALLHLCSGDTAEQQDEQQLQNVPLLLHTQQRAKLLCPQPQAQLDEVGERLKYPLFFSKPCLHSLRSTQFSTSSRHGFATIAHISTLLRFKKKSCA